VDLYKCVQLNALSDVINEPEEFIMRRIMAWYSQTYHTPLHVVEELPFLEILRWYYEDQYSDLGEYERQEKIKELLETEEDRKKRVKKEKREKEEELSSERKFLEHSKEKPQLPENIRRAQAKLLEAAKGQMKPLAKAVDATTKLLKDLPQPTDLISDDWGPMEELPEIKELPEGLLGDDMISAAKKKNEW
jgi:predicted nuclease with TOPRIM domain